MTYWFISISLCYVSLFLPATRWDGQESLKAPKEEGINTGDKETVQSRRDTRSVEVATLNQGGAVASRSCGSRRCSALAQRQW